MVKNLVRRLINFSSGSLSVGLNNYVAPYEQEIRKRTTEGAPPPPNPPHKLVIRHPHPLVVVSYCFSLSVQCHARRGMRHIPVKPTLHPFPTPATSKQSLRIRTSTIPPVCAVVATWF